MKRGKRGMARNGGGGALMGQLALGKGLGGDRGGGWNRVRVEENERMRGQGMGAQVQGGGRGD